MKNLIVVLLLLIVSGCAAGVGPQKVTTTKTDSITNETTITVTETKDTPGLFESGNLNKFYEFKNIQAEKYADTAQKKMEFVYKAGQDLILNCNTRLERALASLNTQLQISMISTAPPNDGIQAPKTMLDFNWVGLLGTGLNAVQIWWNSSGNSSNATSIANNGSGSIFVNSNGNSLSQFDLNATGGEGDGSGTISAINFDSAFNYTPVTTVTSTETRNGDSSYGLQLF